MQNLNSRALEILVDMATAYSVCAVVAMLCLFFLMMQPAVDAQR